MNFQKNIDDISTVFDKDKLSLKDKLLEVHNVLFILEESLYKQENIKLYFVSVDENFKRMDESIDEILDKLDKLDKEVDL